MRVKKIWGVLMILLLAIVFIFSESGCASVVPPTGGPRDSLPPVILSVLPENKTLHFDAKQIKIEFDEYIELNDIFTNLIISPVPKVMPEVSRKLRTVTVKIKDTLQPNTTYVYNFANAIKDLNEGNKGKDLLYVVSTGNYIDSMELSGKVVTAKTGTPDSTLTVMLYNNLDDSAIIKDRPRYITTLDSTGIFFFRHLAPGQYRLYAMKTQSGSYLYTGEETFAFADSVVTIAAEPPQPILLWAYTPLKRKDGSESPSEPPEIDRKDKRLKFTSNLEGNKQDLLSAFILKFENPLKTFDPAKMTLSTDSSFTPVSNYKFTLDSTARIVTMNVPWQEGKKYNLILQKDFASDSIDRKISKTDTLRFTAKTADDYGQVEITFVDVDLSRSPVLLISQGENSLKNAFPIPANRVIAIKYYPPGDYQMSILYDTNKNGKWDPGEFFNEHRQPELIEPIDRKLNVKGNQWLVPFEIRKGK